MRDEAEYHLARDGYYIEGLEHRDIPAWIVHGDIPGLSLLNTPPAKRKPKPRRRDRRKAKAARQARRANR